MKINSSLTTIGQLMLALALTLTTYKGNAQKKPVSLINDPKLSKIRAMKDDTVKVNALIFYLYGNSDIWDNRIDSVQVMPVFKQAIVLADKLNYLKGLITANYYLSFYYEARHNYIDAIDAGEIAIKFAEKDGDKVMLIQLLTDIARIYRQLNYWDKAVAYNKKALKVSYEARSGYDIYRRLYSIGTNYISLSKFNLALNYHKKALKAADSIKRDELKPAIYNEIAWDYYKLNDHVTAYKYATIPWQITTDRQRVTKASLLNTLGCILRDAPNAALAKIGMSSAQRDAKVLELFETSQQMINKYGDAEDGKDNLRDISKIYAKNGDYEKAYKAFYRHIVIRDSLNTIDIQQGLLRLQYREAYAKKETTLMYKQGQQRNYYIGGISALVLASVAVFLTQRRLNKVISREKQRSDNLLANILPANVAEELKDKGTANARLFDEVTVLFTDFVNFTTVSERLSPQQLVDELNHCFIAFDNIITKNSIEKIKTIGDAYLAVSGLPHANVDHAANTVKAAFEIQAFMHQRKANLGDKTFGVRIGIHSGSVVAGIVGVKKFAYDIWGDTVNTAARMEQNSEPGKINVSGETYELVKDKFIFTYRGEIAAKNKGALKMYFVDNEKANA